MWMFQGIWDSIFNSTLTIASTLHSVPLVLPCHGKWSYNPPKIKELFSSSLFPSYPAPSSPTRHPIHQLSLGFFFSKTYPKSGSDNESSLLEVYRCLVLHFKKNPSPNSGFWAWKDQSPVCGFYFLSDLPAPFLPLSTHTGLLSVLPHPCLGPILCSSCARLFFSRPAKWLAPSCYHRGLNFNVRSLESQSFSL